MNGTVRSAARVLDLLEYFAGVTEGVSLAKIAATFNLPKSSALGLLRTLQLRGYLLKDVNGNYRMNARFAECGFGWGGDRLARLIAIARPVMDELSEKLGETVVLGALTEEGRVRIVLRALSTQTVRYEASVGTVFPIHCSAIGRVLLSQLGDLERNALLQKHPLERFTPETIVDLPALNAIIDLAAKQRYCVIVDEYDRGLTGIAMPILDARNLPIAGLNVSCISARITGRMDAIIGLLRHEVDKLTEALAPWVTRDSQGP